MCSYWKNILFLPWDFSNLVMSMSSCLQSQQFISWNAHKVIFFQFILYRFCCFYVCSHLVYAAVIILSMHFFMESVSLCINASTQSTFLQVLFFLLFMIYIVCLSYFWCKALCIVIDRHHLPFQHNELFHLPYMAVAEISLRRISLQFSSVILFFGLLSDEK